MRSSIALVALSLVVAAGNAGAQTPAAPEFIVNTYTTNQQSKPSMSIDSLGRFVVAWESESQDGSSAGVFGQRYDAAGARLGDEFIVNTPTLGAQASPDVAVDAKGDFVVVWVDSEIKARRFARLRGIPLGTEFQVNAYTTGVQAAPAVAIDPTGSFVVAWESAGQDGDSYGVFARRFDAGGTPIGGDFQVNTYTTGQERRPDVAYTSDGGFVVVYDGPDAVGQGIFARRYDAAGNPLGPELPAATAGASQFAASVAALRPSGFVVAWTSYSQDGSHNGIYTRMFDGAGAPTTGEIRANTYTTNAQSNPAVAADGTGGFVVTWDSLLQDGSDLGVFGRRFDAAGAPIGAEFAVNAFTTGAQTEVAVVADSAGNFVTTWSSAQDGSLDGVVGKRFQGLLPSGIAVDTVANGVLEPGETVRVAPSWRNGVDQIQTFQGTLSGLTGPPPATYTIDDPAAAYGPTIPNAFASCGTDCYSVTVTATARPAAHWDASVLETLGGAPATQGLQRRWTLHVGDSFADVPRSNAFYRFVETVLHNSITTGCGSGLYCPAAFTSRAGIAVFVLLAYEGAGYVPRACGTPIFNDVPASSPFCRWIEELARRNIVNGCGGGNYCPDAPVTRAQMTVIVLQTLDPTLVPVACTTPMFIDVPPTSPFCRWVEELVRRGVVTGCGNGNYCPEQNVTREQMSVFMTVVFGLTLYGL